MTDLSELIARLEKATGPDRELDADLTVALTGGEVEWPQSRWTGDTRPVHVTPSPSHLSGFAREPVPLLTASIDAALALVERVRPGRWIEISGPRKYLNIPVPVPNHWLAAIGDSRGWGFTPAIALLLALLRTYEANHD